MKSEIIMINSQGLGIQEALALTEEIGAKTGLEKKEKLHLRLLAEELLGLLRSVAGEVAADYWIVQKDRQFELHMKSEVHLSDKMREQLISVATSGENDAGRGLMGKIRLLIGEVFMNGTSGSAVTVSLMGMASASSQSAGADAYLWSLKKYKNQLRGAGEAWDELEKSIVANIADEVTVQIVGSLVEIVISKAF